MVAQRIAAKEKLLQVADREFYETGIGATGINALTDMAGVARMSLYKNFASKDEVVLEYLERRHRNWLELHRVRVEAAATPLDRAMCVPRSYIDRADQRGEHFRGCGLLNAAGELQTNAPVRQAVVDIKSRVVGVFIDDLRAAGIPDAATTGEELFLLLEGGMVHAGLHASKDNIIRVNSIIERMLRRQLGNDDNPVRSLAP